MTAAVRQRTRIARVRRLQHAAAMGAAAEAEARVATLEGSEARLGELRSVLLGHQGEALGMALAARHELAARLDHARHGLADAIVAARAHALEQDSRRLAARIDQEAADRLAERACAEAEAAAQRRPLPPPRRRTWGDA